MHEETFRRGVPLVEEELQTMRRVAPTQAVAAKGESGMQVTRCEA
jgi:hypothetical protein